MTKAARTAELVTITDGESTHTRTVGEWLDLARRALRALPDAETPGAETNAAGQVPVPERIGGDAGADRAKVLCAERCVQQHSAPAAPSAAPTAVGDDLAEVGQVLEMCRSMLRDIIRRAPGVKTFVDHQAFILNEINPALVRLHRAAERSEELQRLCNNAQGIAAANINRAEAAEQRIKELETQLQAWYSIFGTTQLTHAKARLDVAERRIAAAPGAEKG